MAIQYRFDVLNALKEKGYTTYALRKDKLLSEGAIQRLRNDQPISWENIDKICALLECQPGDIIEYTPNNQ